MSMLILALTSKNAFVIFHKFRKTKHQKLRGIKRARGHYIVTMDGDLQNDPSDIPKMLDIIQNEALDMVIGFRQNRQDPFLKTMPSKIANFIIRMTTQLQIRDSGCALKVMTSKIAKELPLYGELVVCC